MDSGFGAEPVIGPAAGRPVGTARNDGALRTGTDSLAELIATAPSMCEFRPGRLPLLLAEVSVISPP
jgi:hypothetical protein